MLLRHELLPRPRGFTLVEIVIALAVLGLIAIVGSKVFTASVYTNATISKNSVAYASARYALERVSRETREMDKTASLANLSLTTTSSTLSFIKVGPQGQKTVTFTFSGDFAGGEGSLSMAYDGGNTHLLASKLSEGAFSYYASIGASSASPAQSDASDLHYVFIKLKVKPDPAYIALPLATLIYLHNS